MTIKKSSRVLEYLIVLSCLTFGPVVAEGAPRFLELPFSESDVRVVQGWLYDSPGGFDSCLPEEVDRCHRGVDYARAGAGSFDVLAAAFGKAVATQSSSCYGYFVYVIHEERSEGHRYFTLYAHVERNSWTVPFKDLEEVRRDIDNEDFSNWREVVAGEKIGRAGQSGSCASGIHLHFEVQRGGYPLRKTDPYDVRGTRSFRYTHAGGCGRDSLWIECPPTVPQFPPVPWDVFEDNFLDPARWVPFVIPAGIEPVGERNQRLEVFLNAGAANVGVTSRCSVGGDFDVQVDFRLASDGILSWSPNNMQVVKLATGDLGAGTFGLFGVERFSGNVESYHMVAQTSTVGFFATTDVGGTLRLVRSDSTLRGFFHNGTIFVEVGSVLNLPTNPTRFVLNVGSNNPSGQAVTVAFDNFTVNAGTVSCP